jgi:hypothetical protein
VRKLLSLVTIVNAAGPDMNRAETVTMFNDLVVMAPGAIPFAAVEWAYVDDDTVRGTFTKGGDSVAADLTFNDAFELTNFVSDDRLRASPDGKSFTRQRWNTPMTEYRQVGARKLAVAGDAQWYGPDPEGHFTYLEFKVDDITYNVTPAASDAANRRLGEPSRPLSHRPVVPTSAARQSRHISAAGATFGPASGTHPRATAGTRRMSHGSIGSHHEAQRQRH